MHYLLCAYKDGIRTYKNQSNIFGGQCYIELTGIGFDNDSQDNGSDEGMSLFPNPSLDRLNIHFEEESLKSKNIFVFTPSGLQVKSLLTDSDHIEMDISDLPCGLYLLSAQTSNSIFHSRFIVTK